MTLNKKAAVGAGAIVAFIPIGIIATIVGLILDAALTLDILLYIVTGVLGLMVLAVVLCLIGIAVVASWENLYEKFGGDVSD